MLIDFLIFFIAAFLLGYFLGKRIGREEGTHEGITAAPLILREKSFEQGRCVLCQSSVQNELQVHRRV